MSKTIDTLKKSSFKEGALSDHIADTYFYQKPHPKVRKKKSVPALPKIDISKIFTRERLVKIARASIGAAALIFIAVICLSISSHLEKRHLEYLSRKAISLSAIAIVHNGAVNKEFIKRLEFRGYARNSDSRISKDVIIFENPEKYKWGDLSINFRIPLNCEAKKLLVSIKGGTGGERIAITLRDTHNRSRRLNDIYLSSTWSAKTIHLDDIKNDIDLANIDHIRFESGYIGESVKDDDPRINFKIYVKDVSISAEKET